jgi:DNA translocase FtsK/SpoIIIE-like protein
MNRPGDYVLGVRDGGKPFRQSFRKHAHHAYSMATGRGKTTLVQCATAQLLAQHPLNQAVWVDTKGVSLQPVAGMPGLTVYDDPEDIGAMVAAVEQVEQEMKRRIQVRKQTGVTEFPLLLLGLEEGNDFAAAVNSWWHRQPGHKARTDSPALWDGALSRILRQGREMNIHVIGMFQDFTDNQFGGTPLRPHFEVIGLSGFKKQAFERIVGTPVPYPQKGAGRIIVCDGDDRTWVQALYATPEELLAYVRAARRVAA